MALVPWQATVQDESGNSIPEPVVTVRNASDDTLATIYNIAGISIANPVTGDLEGFVQFQVVPGRYKIEGAKGGSLTNVWEFEANDGRSFASRAELVAALSDQWSVGSVVTAGGIQYEYDGVSTSISDMPGWKPFGRITPLHFGAVRDGATSDHISIQSAIDYAATLIPSTSVQRKIASAAEVFFPRGIYALSSGVTVNTSGIRLVGEGQNTSALRLIDETITAVTFVHDDYFNSAGDNVDDVTLVGVGIESLGIFLSEFITTNSCTAKMVKAVRCRLHLENVRLRGYRYGLDIQGALEGTTIDRVRAESYLGSNVTAAFSDSFHVKVGLAEVSASDPDAGAGGDGSYYVKSIGVHISDLDTRDRGNVSIYGLKDSLRIGGADGVYVSNSHLGFGSRAQLAFIPDAPNISTWNFNGTGLFFDCATAIVGGHSDYSVYAYRASGTAELKWVSLSGIRANIGDIAAIKLDHAGLSGFSIDGFLLNGIAPVSGQHGIDVQSGKDINISNGSIGSCPGGHYINVGSSVSTNVNISGINAWDAQVYGSAAHGIYLDDAIHSLNISGNTLSGVYGDPIHIASTTVATKAFSVSGTQHSKSRSVASATDMTLMPGTDAFNVTGTTTINKLLHFFEGRTVVLYFSSAITVQHSATASGNINLARSVDANFLAGDRLELTMIGGKIYETARSEATGNFNDLAVGTGIGYRAITLNGGDGSARNFVLQSNGVNRFVFGMNGSNDYRLARYNSSGVLQENALLVDEATGLVQAPNLQLLFNGDATLTPANNGEVAIETTSNTAITFKYKGSDGIVRTGTITLS